jgi:hypothetical protein
MSDLTKLLIAGVPLFIAFAALKMIGGNFSGGLASLAIVLLAIFVIVQFDWSSFRLKDLKEFLIAANDGLSDFYNQSKYARSISDASFRNAAFWRKFLYYGYVFVKFTVKVLFWAAVAAIPRRGVSLRNLVSVLRFAIFNQFFFAWVAVVCLLITVFYAISYNWGPTAVENFEAIFSSVLVIIAAILYLVNAYVFSQNYWKAREKNVSIGDALFSKIVWPFVCMFILIGLSLLADVFIWGNIDMFVEARLF